MFTLGIDEVGRGCWAGPLVAGAVVLPPDFVLDPQAGWRLDDSKILSAASRERADEAIRTVVLGFGLGWVTAEEVDSMGLTASVGMAMRRAVAAVSVPFDEIIIDGNINYLPDLAGSRAVVKADASVLAVSAASILAKVARDRWMSEAALRFPAYGFESHVGYGTKRHLEALRLYGPCELHRRSYRPVRQFC
jgi:ribonuclease HII